MQQPPQARDLLGYAGSRPHPHWPGGARVAVSIAVNFEEGAESPMATPNRGGVRDRATRHWAAQSGNRQPFRIWFARPTNSRRRLRPRADRGVLVICPMKLQTPFKLSERNFKSAI